jgi:hypothetical protein
VNMSDNNYRITITAEELASREFAKLSTNISQLSSQLRSMASAPAAASAAIQQFHSASAATANAHRAATERLTESFRIFPGVVLRATESLGVLKGGLAALGAYEAVKGITEFVDKMAEMGEKAVNTAAAVGAGTEQFSILSGAIRLAELYETARCSTALEMGPTTRFFVGCPKTSERFQSRTSEESSFSGGVLVLEPSLPRPHPRRGPSLRIAHHSLEVTPQRSFDGIKGPVTQSEPLKHLPHKNNGRTVASYASSSSDIEILIE